MPPFRMPLLGSSWRENINTHGLPQPSPGSRHSWPLVLSYLWLFLAFNFAAGTRLCPQEDPASQADSSPRGRKMSKLSKPSARVPGSDAGDLMRRYTRAWLLGANVHTTEEPVRPTRRLSCALPSSPPRSSPPKGFCVLRYCRCGLSPSVEGAPCGTCPLPRGGPHAGSGDSMGCACEGRLRDHNPPGLRQRQPDCAYHRAAWRSQTVN